MLRLPASFLSAIQAHASETYPLECCGILIGERQGDQKTVLSLRRAGNLNTERAHDRYSMDPKDQIAAEKEARGMGLEVIGYYHSHPDHPALASATDSELAWEGYSYVIVNVIGGKAQDVNSFVTSSQPPQLTAEILEIS